VIPIPPDTSYEEIPDEPEQDELSLDELDPADETYLEPATRKPPPDTPDKAETAFINAYNARQQNIMQESERAQILENLSHLQSENISINKSISELLKSHEHAEKPTHQADDMKQRLNDINKLKSPKSREQALKQFEKDFKVKHENAPAHIKQLEENTPKINDISLNQDIKINQEYKSQVLEKYQKQISEISKRPDGKEIIDELNRMRGENNINFRDISELKLIEKAAIRDPDPRNR